MEKGAGSFNEHNIPAAENLSGELLLVRIEYPFPLALL